MIHLLNLNNHQMKNYTFLTLVFSLFVTPLIFSQSHAEKFWKTLQSHCGHAYEGTITDAPENDDFEESLWLCM